MRTKRRRVAGRAQRAQSGQTLDAGQALLGHDQIVVPPMIEQQRGDDVEQLATVDRLDDEMAVATNTSAISRRRW